MTATNGPILTTAALALLTLVGCGGHSSSSKGSSTAAPATSAATPGLGVQAQALPPGQVGAAYVATLTATHGTSPYTWALASGSSLPVGLQLDPASGALSGTPTTVGTTSFTVEVRDGSAPPETATRGFSIQVNQPAAAAPTVALVTPNGGEVWYGTRDITWTTTSASPGTVEIQLSTDSGVTWTTTIAAAAPDTGTYAWDTSAHANSNTARIRVIATDTFFQSSPPADSAADLSLVNNGLLYAMDFGAPHQVGQTVTTGAGVTARATPTSVPFGTPTVVAGPALEFDSFDNQGDQIRLDLAALPASTSYSLHFDVTVLAADANASFTMLFDTPQVRTLTFSGAGTIRPFVPGVSSGQVIGTFVNNAVSRLRVDVDLVADTWRVFLNGTSVFTSAFGASTQIRSIRFSTNVTPNPQRIRASLDDVVLVGN